MDKPEFGSRCWIFCKNPKSKWMPPRSGASAYLNPECLISIDTCSKLVSARDVLFVMDKYVILKEIGSGSFGKVYMIELKGTGIHYVAKQIDLKKMNKRQQTVAEKEITVLSKLKHGNIVGYKEAYCDEQYLHIVMELCELGDLHGRIQEARVNNCPFSDDQVMEYFVQVCLALEYVHKLRILHRDVKTKNIFLTKRNIVKLGDFGVAKTLENSFELARTCIGSPFYISPEICDNQPYDKKSDVWALGCVLYELTTLRYAFTAKNMKSLLNKISAAECNPIPPWTNPRIKYLIGRILKLNPKERPPCSEILATPFVHEYSLKVNRRPKTGTNIARSISGSDIRIKEGGNFRLKSNRTMLPISKSSLNLTSNASITDPGTKYKTSNLCKQRAKQVVNKLSFRRFEKPEFVALNNELDLTRSSKKNNLDKPKIKRLPKADSLYYTMIEEDNGKLDSKKNSNVIRNMLNEDNPENVCECSEKQFGSKPGDGIQEKAKFISDDADGAAPCRRQWQISTVEKDDLITFLNEVELAGSDSNLTDTTVVCKESNSIRNHKALSVDDMLSMTTEHLHVELLQPQVLYNERKGESQRKPRRSKHTQQTEDLIDLGTFRHCLDDETYVLTPDVLQKNETEFERLEKRRIELEKLLGLEIFKSMYRQLEENLRNGEKYDIVTNGDMSKGGSDSDWQVVWRLVIDDYVYSQQQ